jgi:O-antigen ligase/tetratricopeptide (TPR) repeat protein
MTGFLRPITLAAFLATIMGGFFSMDAGILREGPFQVAKGIIEGNASPILSFAILAVFLALQMFLAKSISLPKTTSWVLALLVFLAVASILWSRFPADSIAAALFLAGLALAFVAATTVDRPRQICLAILIGATVVSVLGIHELVIHFTRSEYNWRVFSLYFNPNALAGMLGLALLVGLSAYRSSSSYPQLLLGLAGIMVFAVFVATQSRGAFISLFVALVALVFFRRLRNPAKWASWIVLPVIVAVVWLGLPLLNRISGGDPMSRLAAGQGSVQGIEGGASSSYRLYLYKGALSGMIQRPLGTGAGTYKWEGGRNLEVIPAHQAHSAYLQLGSDIGPLGPLLLIGVFLFALQKRGERDEQLQQAGVDPEYLKAAAVFVAVHAVVESNLFFAGIAVPAFIVLGLLSADLGLERKPALLHRAWASAACLALLYLGYVEALQASVRYQIGLIEAPPSIPGLDRLMQIASWDDETYSLRSDYEESLPKRIELIERASKISPSVPNLHYLTGLKLQAQDMEGARQAARDVLQQWPNDAETLYLALHASLDDRDESMRLMQRLVALERSPYATVRPISDVVFPYGALARYSVLKWATGPDERRRLLEETATVLVQYVIITSPKAVDYSRRGIQEGYGGETLTEAYERLQIAVKVTDELAKDDSADPRWRSEHARMDKALAELESSLILKGKPMKESKGTAASGEGHSHS